MVSKEVEKVYRAAAKNQVSIPEIMRILKKSVRENDVETVEALAAFVYNKIDDEEIKLNISKILAKNGFYEYVPLEYFEMIKRELNKG